MLLKEVFGVSKNPVASYIERDAVDAALGKALGETEQIIIYGSSKQGKTALLQRHIEDANRKTVHCGPNTTVEDIYRSLLRQYKVEIVTDKASEVGRELGTSISAKFTALIPFFGGGEAEAQGSVTASNTDNTVRKAIEFNLAVAQDVGELLAEVNSHGKFHVLENFHYLADDVQRQLAFDLRTFEEMGLRFVILGVWRERNRLVQYNGDLQDRVAEVPVEPWLANDFERVVARGENRLNISFSQAVKDRIFTESHGSVAVLQELLKALCEKEGIKETVHGQRRVVDDLALLNEAIDDKVAEYAARHVRSLESIAAGARTRRTTDDTVALFLPYYLVKVLIYRSSQELREGIERRALYSLIQAEHSNPGAVRVGDVSGMLSRLAALQVNAKIVPPLFDYDPGTRRLKVVDSTLYFFIDNCDPDEVIADIPNPDSAAP